MDFEFHPDSTPGGKQVPVCMVAKELRSGRLLRYWKDVLQTMREPPFEIGQSSLYVAYLASAELHCHLALGWPLPANVFDCFVEFRTLTNGRPTPRGWGLLGALTWFGLDAIPVEEKTQWRELILTGGPWSPQERRGILDYCQTDVDALGNLFPPLVRALSIRPFWLEHALIRGHYMRAVAAMEYRGVPLDTATLDRLVKNWEPIKRALIARIAQAFPVFEGSTFKLELFEKLVVQQGIPWPRTDTGRISLDQDTFREQVRAYPHLAPLREIRDNLSQLQLSKLSVGPDGRNRVLLGVFKSKTGRNQPSNSQFIFGPSAWLRSLIKPEPGMGLAYGDFSSQEVAIAAKLSGDETMMAGYTSGDLYLDFAVRAGLAPKGANKATHGEVRDQCKAIVLGVQYGMREKTLAYRLGVPLLRGRQLLRAHQETYPQYWKWVENAANFAGQKGYLDTVFGWRFHCDDNTRPTTLQNFPCQANGAEMLRLACIMAHEAGLAICAPVHDAVLLEAPLETLEYDVARLREIMTQAGREVLDGFPVRTDAKIISYPDRYRDPRGVKMWAWANELLDRLADKGVEKS